MVHAKLPVKSLLCLLCTLLMLPPELILGKTGCLFRLPPTDVREYKAMVFAVQQYNQDNQKSSNYFKELHLLEVHTEVVNGVEHHLTVNIVKTGCKKRTGKTKTYKEIQRCEELPGNTNKKTCYFKVSSHPPSNEMKLAVTDCEKTPIEPVCIEEGI